MSDSAREVKPESRDIPWAPRIQRFTRSALEKVWPRVLTVESALYANELHETGC